MFVKVRPASIGEERKSVLVSIFDWHHQQTAFFEPVQVQTEVAWWLNTCIGKQLIDNSRGTVIDTFYITKVVNRGKDLVWFS